MESNTVKKGDFVRILVDFSDFEAFLRKSGGFLEIFKFFSEQVVVGQ